MNPCFAEMKNAIRTESGLVSGVDQIVHRCISGPVDRRRLSVVRHSSAEPSKAGRSFVHGELAYWREGPWVFVRLSVWRQSEWLWSSTPAGNLPLVVSVFPIPSRTDAPLVRAVFSKNNPVLAFNDLANQTDLDEQQGMMHLSQYGSPFETPQPPPSYQSNS
jgi:hypothetical protein